jgi:hypothetical protein
MEIPSHIYELYVLAKRSFTLYEAGEVLQSTETAFELRDLADHLIMASQQTDPHKAEIDYQQAAEHILNIAIDPLQRRTHKKILRIRRRLRWYAWYRVLYEMPNRVLVKHALLRVTKASRLVDARVAAMRQVKGRTDVPLATECYGDLEQAYKLASDIESLINASLQNFRLRTQVFLAAVAVLALLLAAAALWAGLNPLFDQHKVFSKFP